MLRFPSPISRRLGAAVLAFAAMLGLPGCGYNEFQSLDEQVTAAWAEVLSQYQRRSDLIPNIVATVKGEANFEQETLTKVIEARSRATAIQATPALVNDPEAFARFQAAQGELSGALSRLLVVTENYPNLKANAAFQDLRVQLEGTENRITVARNKFIAAVQQYNTHVRSVPTNFTAMIFGYKTKPTFTVANEAQISVPPPVSFDKPASR
jgi:LemA protein